MPDKQLDLKYRPRKFADVLGNAGVVKLLLTRSLQGTIGGRSMMFGGPKGCGKTSLARIAARAVVCDELDQGEPCGTCASCQSVQEETSVSFDEFDAATQGTVDRIKSILEDLEYGNFDGKPTVVILDEAHRLSAAAQDALLKSVEDRRLVVILCTTEPHKIKSPIRQRVEEYSVSAPSADEMLRRLTDICASEGIRYDPGGLGVIVQSLGSCPRECICSLETLSGLGPVTAELARSYLRYDRMEAVVEVLRLIDSAPVEAFAVLDKIAATEGPIWIRDTMVAAVAGALRQSVGAKSAFPVPVGFFDVRGKAWADLARTLGSVERPGLADIEAALLSTSPFHMESRPAPAPPPAPAMPPPPPLPPPLPPADPAPQQTAPPAPPPHQPPASAAPVAATPAPKCPPAKSIEVNGVKFSAAEKLTTLDDRMERTSGPPAPPEKEHAKVEWDSRHVPLPDKEFASGLVRRIKGQE